MRLGRVLLQGGALAVLVGGLAVLAPRFASGADHTDSAAAGGEPLADIGDLYAWMDSGAANLNLVMTVGGVSQPAEFGTAVTYVFHVHRGAAFGNTPDETRVMCQFADASNLECWVRDLSGAMPTTVAYVAGDPSDTAGITSDSPAGLRVFAGLRNDPFFFNLDGFNDTVQAVRDAISMDPLPFTLDEGCPELDNATATALVNTLQTDSPAMMGGTRPTATDDLATINAQALVVQLDKTLIAGSGDILAVWAATHRAQ